MRDIDFVTDAHGEEHMVWADYNMVKLLNIPARSQLKRLTLRVNLSETRLNKVEGKGTIMRCVFTTELKIDIDTTDDPLRKAFIDLVVANARAVYGTAGMLAKGTPVVNMFVTTREGREVIPLFDKPTQESDDDEEDI